MNRRELLIGVAAAAAVGTSGYAWSQRGGTSPADIEGKARLQMPPLLDTSSSGKLQLAAQSSQTRFFANAAASPTLGYNQGHLGPTVRLRNGPLAATVLNELDRDVSLHWHGLLVPGEHDGGPHLAIRPGRQWVPEMQIKQAPCTALYHTHVHRRTAPDVYFGLAGALHVTDGRDDERGLPTDYGSDDLTLILQDRRFDERGRMVYAGSMMDDMHGFTGDTMMVNGQLGSVAAVPAGIVRLRLINASNARIYSLFADDNRPLHLIATDGGFLPAPLSVDRVSIAPGERVELLVDCSDRHPFTLMSAGDPNQGPGGMMGGVGRALSRFIDGEFSVIPFTVDETASPRITQLPDHLGAQLPDLSADVGATREFSLDMGMGGGMMGGMMGGRSGDAFAINGRPFRMDRIDLEIAQGVVERWIITSSMLTHPFHVHGALFQVESENGGDVRPENSGWKDTVVVGPEARILVRFDHTADRNAPYMYHCHILEHEDGGMMGQLTVG